MSAQQELIAAALTACDLLSTGDGVAYRVTRDLREACARAMVQPVGEVPMPDDNTSAGYTPHALRTYGDARAAAGYAAGVAAGGKDAERYRAGMREMIDCRTCRNHTRDGCIQTALCVDADGYRRALPVRFWVATHSAALAEGEAG